MARAKNGLLGEQTANPGREPAGSAEGFGWFFRRDPVFLQMPRIHFADLLGQPGEPAGRQLLATNFEKKLAVHDHASTFGSASCT
jgi:hypothetical protein